MNKSKKNSDDRAKENNTAKTKSTSDGAKDVNEGGKPANEIKRGKGETTGSRGTRQ